MDIWDLAKKGDLPGLQQALSAGAAVNARSKRHYGFTPLMCAARSVTAKPDLLAMLIKHGADVNATPDNSDTSVLGLAASSGNVEKSKLLLDSGADIKFKSKSGYDALIHAMHGRRIGIDPTLLELIKLLISRGAPLNGVTKFQESALSVSSNNGRFDAVRLLLEAGADPAPLGWNELMRTIALGTLEELGELLKRKVTLATTDRWNRTPLLLSIQTGDISRVKLLLKAGARLAERGRCGKTALMYTLDRDDQMMLKWLIAEGAEIDAVNEFGYTALIEAVMTPCDPEIIRTLLQSGANPQHQTPIGRAIQLAETPEIVWLLVAAGEDINLVSGESRAKLLGLGYDGTITASKEDFEEGKYRKFGKSNPERMQVSFWQAMIRSGASAYAAKVQFQATEPPETEPVWCFQRFGCSLSFLEDGRIVQIGGEHEDDYMPDFCIYNDIIVHNRDGSIDILGYPENIFPPTDFHSATVVGNSIYIIGALGYPRARILGLTPVYRLCCTSFSIERINVSGVQPGWIYKHRARLQDNRSIVVSGGVIISQENIQQPNTAEFALDLETWTWSRLLV